MKTQKLLVQRGIRISDEDWAEYVEIAEEESKRTGKKVTASDVIRFAGAQLLKRRREGKPIH